MKRNDILKIIALVTMFVDHTGVLLFPSAIYLRFIGRIAFPIFAYLITIGYKNTSDRRKYKLRLLLFGLIAQIPYIFLNYNIEPNPWHFNVILFFLYSTFILDTIERFKSNPKRWPILIVIILLIILPQVLEYNIESFGFSYGTYGILIILIFYLFDRKWMTVFYLYIILSFIFPYIYGVQTLAAYHNQSFWEMLTNFREVWDFISRGFPQLTGYFFQMRSLIALPFIFLQDFYRGPRLNKWVAYIFYPAHITILLLIRLILGGPIG